MTSAAPAVQHAARRVGCSVGPSVLVDGVPVSRVWCRDAAHAAELLAVLAEADATRPDVQELARWLLEQAPGRLAFSRAVQRFIQARVRFVREPRERFARTDLTIAHGIGDCDDHARAVMALLLAGGVPARLVTLRRNGRAVHVLAQAFAGGTWRWLETTVAAHFDEPPHTAAIRVGASRRDISDAPQPVPVKVPMTATLDPKLSSSTVPLLRRAGYLPETPADPTAEELRDAAKRFQADANSEGWAVLSVDGIAGPLTRGALARVLLQSQTAAAGELGDLAEAGRPPRPAGLDDAFFQALSDVSETLRIPKRTMLAVMAHESGISASVGLTGKDTASGLIGFMNLKAVGFSGTHDEFKKLTPAQQMTYVLNFWRSVAGVTDPITLHQFTFVPASLSRGTGSDSVVIVDKDGSGYNGWEARFYTSNTGLDVDKDGKITRGDLRKRLAYATNTIRYKQAAAYAEAFAPSVSLRVPPLVGVPLLIAGAVKLLPFIAAKLAGVAWV